MKSVSVIIPSGDSSRGRNLELLLADLKAQTLRPAEIEIVRRISPSGRARNLGVEHTTGEIVVFLDDDVRLGTAEILQAFVDQLSNEPRLGMVGTSQLVPPDSTVFQRRCARQVSRSESALVSRLTESDMVTTACCAMRRSVLLEVGGFHNQIIRGVDPELRHRVRQAGYRIAVVPQCWHYHPMPPSLRLLLRMAWRNGVASAYARKRYPETVLFNPEGHVADFEARPPLPRRVLCSGVRLLTDLALGRWYGALYGLAYAAGSLLGRARG